MAIKGNSPYLLGKINFFHPLFFLQKNIPFSIFLDNSINLQGWKCWIFVNLYTFVILVFRNFYFTYISLLLHENIKNNCMPNYIKSKILHDRISSYSVLSWKPYKQLNSFLYELNFFIGKCWIFIIWTFCDITLSVRCELYKLPKHPFPSFSKKEKEK